MVVRTYLVRRCDQYGMVDRRPHNVPVWSLGSSCHVPATNHYNITTMNMGITKLLYVDGTLFGKSLGPIWYGRMTSSQRASLVVRTFSPYIHVDTSLATVSMGRYM